MKETDQSDAAEAAGARRPLRRLLDRVSGSALDWAYSRASRLAPVRRRIEREYDALLAPVENGLRPYTREYETFRTLPRHGIERRAILDAIGALAARERGRWSAGYVSGAVYHGDEAHVEFLNQAYALASQTNPLHSDVWPSLSKFEAEIVSMTAAMLGGAPLDVTPAAGRVVGTVTSGGTESIVLAMKAYRDRARKDRSAGRVSVVVPGSAHAAFDKAAELLGMDVVRVPVGADYRADVRAMRQAISSHTVLLVGSAPSFPHGTIDPIGELSALAIEKGLGLHVDACLGAFVLPWARRLGYAIPDFDFGLPGVTSISADTHKYGYAAKGTSVILYRGEELRRFQYFVTSDWPGGLYFSPTLAGSRSGGLSAACWASLLSVGESGYLEATQSILETARVIRSGIEAIPELYVLGDPLWVIAFASRSLDIYRVLDALGERGWSLNGLQRPPSVHLCITLPHTRPGVAERFLWDLRGSVESVRASPPKPGGMAPIYGMSGSFPVRGAVRELLRRYVDRLYEP